MGKLINNQVGFGTVEVILIIVIVALLGVIGWFVYDRSQNKTTSISTTTAPTAPTKTNTTIPLDETAGWLKYTSQNSKYILAIPDGWKLTVMKGDDNPIAWNASDIKYISGTAGKVTVVEGGRDGSSTAFYLLYNYKINEGTYLSQDLKKIKSYKTVNGVYVVKSSRTQTKEPEGMDIPMGTVEYTYDLSYKSKNIHIVHDVLTGEPDQSKRIEQMIGTLKFL